MYAVSAKQMRMARAYFAWTRHDVAEATGLSINTVRNVEMGIFSPRGETAEAIKRIFEAKGLEFLPSDGVRHCIEDIAYFFGPDSCEQFFGDLTRAARVDAADVFAYVLSQEMLVGCCGGNDKTDLRRLEKLDRVARVKCLMPDTEKIAAALPQFEFRFVARDEMRTEPFFVYGNNVAVVQDDGGGEFRFVVFRFPGMAYNRKRDFRALWETASTRARAGRRPQ